MWIQIIIMSTLNIGNGFFTSHDGKAYFNFRMNLKNEKSGFSKDLDLGNFD